MKKKRDAKGKKETRYESEERRREMEDTRKE